MCSMPSHVMNHTSCAGQARRLAAEDDLAPAQDGAAGGGREVGGLQGQLENRISYDCGISSSDLELSKFATIILPHLLANSLRCQTVLDAKLK